MTKRILVVDDEPRIVNSLEVILSERGYQVSKAASGTEALEIVGKDAFDLVIADLILPGMTGLELLRALKKTHPLLPVFIVTTFGTINAAVLAMKEGAEDFVTKPILESEIKLKIDKAIEKYQMLQENLRLREEVREKYSFEDHGHVSGAMQEIYLRVREFAKNDRPVWITGESGAGKETIAKSIHYNSLRSRHPIIKVDCSIIPRNAQLRKIFGGKTGPRGGKEGFLPGEVDLAAGGSLFFEHVDQLSPDCQAKLLRLVEEGKVDRTGEPATDTIDVRILCSSVEDLGALLSEGRFRQDLYYHLSVLPLVVPPLRDRKEDILPLVNKFIHKWSEIHHKPVRHLSHDALDLLNAYHWPGNIRELENVIERAVLLAKGEVIEPDNLLITIVRLRQNDPGLKQLSLEVMEKNHIARVLEYTNWNKTKASQILGINRKTLLEKRKKYSLR